MYICHSLSLFFYVDSCRTDRSRRSELLLGYFFSGLWFSDKTPEAALTSSDHHVENVLYGRI